MDRLISEKAIVDVLSKGYWDKNLQSAKDDPCVIDAMIDWAIRRIKTIPSAEPKVVPIANIHFDEDKMREVCKEVAENIVVEYDFKGKRTGKWLRRCFRILMKCGLTRNGGTAHMSHRKVRNKK